jgi:hypothetical protein
VNTSQAGEFICMQIQIPKTRKVASIQFRELRDLVVCLMCAEEEENGLHDQQPVLLLHDRSRDASTGCATPLVEMM